MGLEGFRALGLKGFRVYEPFRVQGPGFHLLHSVGNWSFCSHHVQPDRSSPDLQLPSGLGAVRPRSWSHRCCPRGVKSKAPPGPAPPPPCCGEEPIRLSAGNCGSFWLHARDSFLASMGYMDSAAPKEPKHAPREAV